MPRCGCGYLHAHLDHVCDRKPSRNRVIFAPGLSPDGRTCTDCPCAHVPCRACFAEKWLPAKFELMHKASIERKTCIICNAALPDELTRKSHAA